MVRPGDLTVFVDDGAGNLSPEQHARVQYDYQTIVTHDLAHAVGLEHSQDAASVLYESLSSVWHGAI